MQSYSDRGGLQSCGTGLCEETDVLFLALKSIQTCFSSNTKSILKPEIEHMCLL